MPSFAVLKHIFPTRMRKHIRRHFTDHIPYGFGNPSTLLARMLPQRAVGAEIGVWRGDFSAMLLEKAAPRKLYLVDPWQFQPEFSDNGYGGCGRPFRGALANSQKDMDEMHEFVRRRMKDRSEVQILRIKSSAISSHIVEGELDWIYIDGNHAYEYVLADLHVAWKLVKPGGLITGDDFNFKNQSSNYGVRTALVEFCNEKDALISVIGNSQFMLQR